MPDRLVHLFAADSLAFGSRAALRSARAASPGHGITLGIARHPSRRFAPAAGSAVPC